MRIIYPPDLPSRLCDCYLILDTNVFFHAVENKEFYKLLLTIQDDGCELLTIPSVVFEFSRGAKSVEEYNWYVDYINSLGVVVYKTVEDRIGMGKAFSVILQAECKKAGGNASYTDFLLMMLLRKFSHSRDKVFLMTANYKDVPTSLFDREDLIALEYQKGIQTQALYRNTVKPLPPITTKTNIGEALDLL